MDRVGSFLVKYNIYFHLKRSQLISYELVLILFIYYKNDDESDKKVESYLFS